MEELKKQFGFRLRQIREELNRTQREFADILGVSVDFLSLIERGRNAPSFGNLEKMARVVKRPVAYFFTFDPHRLGKDRRARRATLRTAAAIVRRPSAAANLGSSLLPAPRDIVHRNSVSENPFGAPQSISHKRSRLSNAVVLAPKPRAVVESFVFGDVKVDLATMEVYRGGQVVPLTKKEFEILTYMIKNYRRVISREEFLNEVWGYENYPSTRTVDNHLLSLRQKLEAEPARPRHFQTVHGTGYRFLPEP